MGGTAWLRPQPRLAVFRAPYLDFETIDTHWAPPEQPLRGHALLWWLVDSRRQENEFEWLYERPPGLPLIVALPSARDISRAVPLLNYVSALEPRAILPIGRLLVPPRIREILAMPPKQLGETVTAYLTRRGLLMNDDIRREVRRTFELAGEVKSISRLALRLHSSRRTLGRHFEKAGLPVPSHWLQFARLLHVAIRLQNEATAAFRIAARFGYPDGFTMSNQMKRLIGARPTEVRRCLGWEWIIESWLCHEARRGAIDVHRYGDAIRPYLLPARGGHRGRHLWLDREEGSSRNGPSDEPGDAM